MGAAAVTRLCGGRAGEQRFGRAGGMTDEWSGDSLATSPPWRFPLLAALLLLAAGAGGYLLVSMTLGGGNADGRAAAAVITPPDPAQRRTPLSEAIQLGSLTPGLPSGIARDPGRPAAPPVELVETVVEVRSGDTLMGLLTGAGASRGQAHAAIEALSREYDPRHLRPGQEIELALRLAAAEGGEESFDLEWLRLVPGVESEIHVQREPEGFVALAMERPLTSLDGHAEGEIRSSLFAAAAAEGVPQRVLVEAIRAMSFDVDFQRDIQPGDGYELLFEAFADESGETVKSGELLYVSLTLSGRERAYYRFEDAEGMVDYFDRDGLSARRGLLRTPVDGARISSNYGMRRHPILGYSRMHKGVDFAAPTGTPIYAAGDGVVQRANWNGGYGNYVLIRHGNGYATAYAHLSRFARGVQAGSRVRQGEVIGYIGSTGASTGPHLHYEVHVNGEQVNPASIKLPTGRQLEGTELAAFRGLIRGLDERRNAQRRLQIARVAQDGCEQGDTPHDHGC